MEAYPLQWPAAWPRTEIRKSAVFKVNMNKAVDDLYNELEALGADNIVVSSNLQVRLDGRPLSKQRVQEDPGVAVYFEYEGRSQCIPCDKWTNVKDNIRAIGLTVEALRGLERWGAKEMVNAAFQGFTALPAQAGRGSEEWWQVLGLAGPTKSRDDITEAYKKAVRTAHPDGGGSDQEFQRVQEARRRGLEMADQ